MKYQILNWSEYNKALIQRGSINLWIDEKALKQWFSNRHFFEGGRPEIYSDEAIALLLTLREVFRLSLRALVGFVQSLFNLMKLELPVPSYTQVCRRAQKLSRKLKRLSRKRPKDIVFDSTGLKVYGEGEWKVKIHGKMKRRTWRKLHLGSNPETQEIILSELTGNNEDDGQVGRRLLDRINHKLNRVYGDGAYDKTEFREKVYEKGARSVVPPRRDARYKGEEGGWKRDRDEDLEVIMGLGGTEESRRLWKKLTGYHRRSLGETAFSRMKRRFGSELKARSMEGQKTEAYFKCAAMNTMTRTGMPRGRWI